MTEEIREQLEGLLLATGFDDCILGVAERCGQPDVVAYDAQAIVASLERDGMREEEAWEYFWFNISGSYVGELTPVFIHTQYANNRSKTDSATSRKKSSQRQENGDRKTHAIRGSEKRETHRKRQGPARVGRCRSGERSGLKTKRTAR